MIPSSNARQQAYVFYRICLVCCVLILSLKPGIGAAQTGGRLISWKFSHTFFHDPRDPPFVVCFPDAQIGAFATDGEPSGQLDFGDNPEYLHPGEKIIPAKFRIEGDKKAAPSGHTSFNFAHVQVNSQNPEQVCVDFRISYFWAVRRMTQPGLTRHGN